MKTMTTLDALVTLADLALESCPDRAAKLACYQATAIAFAGICPARSQAAMEVAKALLAAEEAQLQFRALLLATPPPTDRAENL